jgi:hypothetical protein
MTVPVAICASAVEVRKSIPKIKIATSGPPEPNACDTARNLVEMLRAQERERGTGRLRRR